MSPFSKTHDSRSKSVEVLKAKLESFEMVFLPLFLKDFFMSNSISKILSLLDRISGVIVLRSFDSSMAYFLGSNLSDNDLSIFITISESEYFTPLEASCQLQIEIIKLLIVIHHKSIILIQ
ncbi:hypothetical protein LguiA_007134 [Lonicera macranthoides]